MDSRKKAVAVGVKFADGPTNEKRGRSNGAPEAVPDRDLIRIRTLELRPDLDYPEPELLSTPFKAYRQDKFTPAKGGAQQAKAKRHTGKPRRVTRSLHKLHGFRPTRLDFQTVPTGQELDDDWYRLVMFSLFVRVHSFAKWLFGGESSFPDDWKASPWLQDFSKDFIYYTLQVARGDPVMGGWDALLCRPLERTFLVTGILAKVLEVHVFSELLFGADEAQKQMLQAQDLATINLDGYRRTMMRADAVKACLDNPDFLPRNFWQEVDMLAMQTTALLLPLLNIRGRNTNSGDLPDLRDVHQRVHNIIAEAGFLLNMMRRSSSVFSIEFPCPGESWNLDQEHVHGGIFEDSEEAAIIRDNLENNTSPLPLRVGRVQISLWPIVKRFTPIGTVNGFANKGEKISSIIKGQAVYYSGMDDDKDDVPDLFAHIRATRARTFRNFAMVSTIICFLLCLALLLKVYFLFQPEASAEWQRPIGTTTPELVPSTCSAKSVNFN